MTIDELRIIEHTNTQVRYLPIVSQILHTVGNRSISLTILKNLLIRWSVVQERESSFYKNHNGILTNNETPTTAFSYYIELMQNFGLLTKINEVVRNSKYGDLFLILKKFDTVKSDFSDIEKLFFMYFILLKDADNIILILQIIFDNNKIADNNRLSKQYEIYLKERLKIKANKASSFSQNSIIEKLRRVEYVWQHAEEYSKHIIPPRIEWLIDLGILVQTNKNKRSTFGFTIVGMEVYNSFDFIDDSKIKDISDFWLVNKFIYEFQFLATRSIHPKDFCKLDEISINDFLNDILPIAYRELDKDGLRRISGLPFYLFIMIIGLVKYNLLISFSALKSKLSQSFSTKEYTFAYRDSTRINESYLTVSINEV